MPSSVFFLNPRFQFLSFLCGIILVLMLLAIAPPPTRVAASQSRATISPTNPLQRQDQAQVLGNAGDLDTSFDPKMGVITGGEVRAVAVQGDGKIVLGGWFTLCNGVARRGIARINSDGSLDSSFNPGTGANALVTALAIQSDGKILLAGLFTTYNGVDRTSIARLNSDGSLDLAFTPPPPQLFGYVFQLAIQSDGKILAVGGFVVRLNSDGTKDSTFHSDIGGGVSALAVQTNGKIVVGGGFSPDGQTLRNWARLNSDGSPDTSFDMGLASSSHGVNAIAIQPDGKILVGGFITQGATSFVFVRLNSNGSVDSFGALGNNPGPVGAMALQSDGKILLGGVSTMTNSGATGHAVLRLNSDCSLDSSFDPGVPGIGGGVTVYALALQNDGKVLVGGDFTEYNGVSHNGFSRLNNDGSLDPTLIGGVGNGGIVRAIAGQTDGKIVIGGEFTTYNGTSRHGIARINSDGSLDASFNPGTGVPWNHAVSALGIQGDGKIVIGGIFSTFNGTSRHGIVRLNSDGSLDTLFNGEVNNGINVLALQTDGKILIGGNFTDYNGTSRNGIARINNDGSLDTSFNPGTGAVGTVDALAIQSDGKILIGGFITSYNGANRNNLARANSDGSLDTSFDPGAGANSNVFTLAIQNDKQILLGGLFSSYNGVGRNGVARVSSNGNLDPSFNPGTGATTDGTSPGTVYSLALQSDGRIVIAGQFSNYNGASRADIARINSDGSLDMSFNPGTGATNTPAYGELCNVYALAIPGDGKILIGGNFINYNGVSRNGIARVLANVNKANQTLTFGPLAPRTVGETFTVSATATSGLAVGFSILSGPATISGNTVTITGPGTVTVRASQAGDNNYNAATQVDQSFTVSKANQAITFGVLASKTFGDAPFTVSATASSGLAVSFSVFSGPATISGNTVTITGAGPVTVRAAQAGDSNYNAASTVDQAFAVAKANQTITFGGLASKTFGDAPFTVSATASSGLAVSFTIFSGPATISGNTVTITGAGTVTVRASQPGDSNYNAATAVDQAFTVNKATTSTAVSSSLNRSAVGQSVTFTATVASGAGIPTGTVQFKDNGTLIGTSQTLNASGQASISTSSLTLGTHMITADYSGDANFGISTGVLLGDQIVGSVIQFSLPNYQVIEANERVNLTLTRSGDTTTSASVTFATIDDAGLTNCNVFNGIASPRCDYENTIGTATWAAGDATSKTFSIAIVDDSYAEGTEFFTISLNNPSGATLGVRSTATVTIFDSGLAAGTNPIDSTNFFVRQQYLDFLGREPDPPGLAGWAATINNCSGDTTQCDRIHVAQLFFQSAEFQDRGYFVYRFYPVAFGRKPDYSEFVPDLASVSGFLDANQLEAAKVAFIAGFMARPAFVSAYNSLTNQQYVDALLNTAGVTLSNRQAMIDALNNSTTTRAIVLRAIVESTEVSTKYNHQAYAVMEYFGYLRRQPDAFYLQWIAALDANNDARGMVTGFVTSQEYRNRFGP